MKIKKSDNELMLEEYERNWASNAFRAFYKLLKCEIKQEQELSGLEAQRNKCVTNYFFHLESDRISKFNRN